jgi:hypothetical protein
MSPHGGTSADIDILNLEVIYLWGMSCRIMSEAMEEQAEISLELDMEGIRGFSTVFPVTFFNPIPHCFIAITKATA